MRLTETQIHAIHATAEELFGSGARVNLFGSRIDDHQRGGEIDLLIEVDRVLDNCLAMAARFSARLQRRIGDQRIDVLISCSGRNDYPVILFPTQLWKMPASYSEPVNSVGCTPLPQTTCCRQS